MLTDNVKTFYPEPFITVREDKRRDWSEIAVYVDAVAPLTATRICAAIISHPCAGAKWFVYTDGGSQLARRIACRSRKQALAFAIDFAKQTDAWRTHTAKAA